MRQLIYPKISFEDFLTVYLHRFPNDIIPEITEVNLVSKEEKEDSLKYKSIIVLYDSSPKILKKFGINLTKGEIYEKTFVDFKNKIITVEAVNKTLSSILRVHEKEKIYVNDEDIIWESKVKVSCLVPGGSSVALDRYQEYKRLEKEIMDTYLSVEGKIK